MNKDIKFMNLGPKERLLLLTALGFDTKKLKCKFCKKGIDYKSCGIFPPILIDRMSNATITCDSPLCISAYLDEIKE